MLNLRSCACGGTQFAVDAGNGDVICMNWRCNRVTGRLASAQPQAGKAPEKAPEVYASISDDVIGMDDAKISTKSLLDHLSLNPGAWRNRDPGSITTPKYFVKGKQ